MDDSPRSILIPFTLQQGHLPEGAIRISEDPFPSRMSETLPTGLNDHSIFSHVTGRTSDVGGPGSSGLSCVSRSLSPFTWASFPSSHCPVEGHGGITHSFTLLSSRRRKAPPF